MTKPKKNPPRQSYNCLKCPGYCCTYPRICVTQEDIALLAEHHGLTHKQAAKKFTKDGHEPGEIILRRQEDEHFGTACMFLDQESRGCTIYEGRPTICREFPGVRRCGYYDFLSFERRTLEDADHISVTNNDWM